MTINKSCLTVLSCLLFSTAHVDASAIDNPALVGSERQQKRFEREPQLKITDDVIIEDGQEQNDVEGADKITFELKSVEIIDGTVFSNGEIEELYSDKIGTTVTLEEIYNLRDSITKLYREEGYILSRAILPPQRIKDGNVQIRIIEGHLNDVSIQGDFKGNEKILNSYISKIKTGGPLNSRNLERYILLINDLYGASANAIIKPADNRTGAADLVIVLDHNFVDGQVGIDNSGTKFIGEYLVSGEMNVNSTLGMSEEVSFRAIFDAEMEELAFGDITYAQPIGYEGTEFSFNYGITRTTPGSTLEVLDILGETESVSVGVTHPFIRSRRENFSGRVEFASTDSESDSGAVNLFEDSTRVLTVGGTYDFVDNWQGVNLVDLALHSGLDVFGASDDDELTSRANGSATFTKITAEFNRLQPIKDDLYFYFASQGQYSFDSLLVGEEFGIGGEYGRGYDFSELTGDSGVAAQFELQQAFDGGYDILEDYQLYLFYDIGSIWQKNAIAGQQSQQSLASTGLGFRFNFINDISGKLQLSKPLTREVGSEGDDDARLHFGLNWIF